VEAVCAAGHDPGGGDRSLAVLDGLASLVDKSLLRQGEAAGEPRFTMLETVREFALERLRERDEAGQAHRRHAVHFLALAEAAALWGPQGAEGLDRLGREYANLRAALRWFLERRQIVEGLRLGAALGRFWALRGLLTEGREWLRRFLEVPPGPGIDPPRWRAARAAALHAAGSLAYGHDDYPAARTCYTESLRLCQALGDEAGAARAVQGLGDVCFYENDRAGARGHMEQALALWRDLGDRWGVAQALYGLGRVAAFLAHDYAGARPLLEASLAVRREVHDREGVAWSLHILGLCACWQGELAAAERLFADALAVRQAVGDRLGAAYSLLRLGNLAGRRGARARAGAALTRCLVAAHEFGDKWLMSHALDEFAGLMLARGQAAACLRLSSAAHHLRQAIGAAVRTPDQAIYDQTTARARAALPIAAAAAAWAEGEALSLDQAVAYALEATPPPARRRNDRARWSGDDCRPEVEQRPPAGEAQAARPALDERAED
jgi:tetratricopeptide (TPR) repeat protein